MKKLIVTVMIGLGLAGTGIVELPAAESSVAQKIKGQLIFTTPIIWLGTNEPPISESTQLQAAIDQFQNGHKAGCDALAAFVANNLHSTWTPSVRLHLAQELVRTGEKDASKQQWNAVVDELKNNPSPQAAKMLRVAETSLAKGGHRHEHSPSCGTLSLSKLISHVLPKHPAAHDVTHIASPTNGFSLLELKHIAASNNVPALVVRRTGVGVWTIPAIAHLNGDHFVTITGQADGKYRVYDSKHVDMLWRNPSALEKELSGSFLIVGTNAPAGFELMLDQVANQIRGTECNVPSTDIDDSEDDAGQDDGAPCPPPPPATAGDGPGAGSGSGCTPENGGDSGGEDDDGFLWSGNLPNSSGGNGLWSGNIPSSPGNIIWGMPRWRISEPYISLWLHDAPLYYRDSSRKAVSLRLSYNQRAEDKGDAIPGFGPKWECDWFGFLQLNTNDVVVRINNFHAGGGRSSFPTDAPDFGSAGARESKGGRRLIINNFHAGGSGAAAAASLSIENRAGKKNEYGFRLPYGNGTMQYFLTNRIDAYGRNIRFGYTSNNIGGVPVYRLNTMADMDGKQCTLEYTNSAFPNRVTSVTDPYDRKARFFYDNLGRLTNITDMAGMASSFRYDEASGVITNLVTPYGTNSFRHLSVSNGIGDWCRAVEITEPEGKQQLYMFRSISSFDMIEQGLPAFWPTLRNSYHWNRAQYAQLDAAAKADVFSMAATNYLNASIKNWYVKDRFSDDGSYVSDAMNAQAGPAVDGVTRVAGVKYVYQGQIELEFSKGFYGIGVEGTFQNVTDIQWSSGDRIEIPRNEWGRPTNFVYYRYDSSTGSSTAGYTNGFDAGGRILEKVWGPQGELLRRYGYHSVKTNLLTSVTNALDEVIRYTHDSAARVTSIKLPSGLLTTNNYYPSGAYAGFLEYSIDVGFRTNRYAYLNGNLWVHTNELGLITTNLWDNLNRLTSIIHPDGTTVSNIYHRLDLVAKKDRLNNWTYFGYNNLRQLVAVTNANGQFTLYDYCNCGSPSEINQWTGSSYLTTTFQYDVAGRRTNVTYPDGYYMNYSFDAGWPNGTSTARIQDASGLVLHLKNSEYGQLAELGLSQNPNSIATGFLSQRKYDRYGRLASLTDRNGITITNAYDVLGRLTNRATLGINGYTSNTVSYAYTAAGVTNVTDELDKKTWFVYDPAGRLLRQTNANTEVLQFTYNAADQMLTLKDGKDQQTSWNYDEYGRVTNKVDAASTVIFRYKYDQLHRLTNRWTVAKGDTFYKYDPIGNLTNVDYPGTTMDIAMKYDGLNRLTNVVDAVGMTKFGYDNGGRLTSEDGPWADDTVTYSYSARRRAGMSLIQPNASPWAQGYGYDQYNRLSNVVSAAGNFINAYWYDYSPVSDRVEFVAWGGPEYYTELKYIYNAYDALARLSSTSLKRAASVVLSQHSYEMNKANQRTRQRYADDNSAGNTHFTDYTYDDIGQLKTAKGTDRAYDYGLSSFVETPRLHEQFGYAYDTAWNLNYRTNNALTQTFNVDNKNQLSSATRSGTFTVSGQATGPRGGDQSWGNPQGVTNVVVSGTGLTTGNANLYHDGAWAKAGATLANGNNTYTATAKDTYDRTASDSLTLNLPTTVNYQYDGNGNLTNDSRRVFEYDYENQLTNVYVASAWKSEFKYDAFGRKRTQKEYTWTTDGSLQSEFITATTLGTTRNNHSGWVGFRLLVGSEPITVEQLGRWVVSGNSGTHTVKIVQASGTDLSGASVSVATAGAPAGQFKYVALASPVTLAANTAYYVVSQETSGGDSWYENNTTVTTAAIGSLTGFVWANNGSTTYNVYTAPNATYVPVGFKYKGGWMLTNEIRYVYDGMLVVQERDANNLAMVSYTRGNDLSGSLQGAGGIGGLLARTANSQLLSPNSSDAHAYYHADGNGNITALVNTNGIVVARYNYDPYGNMQGMSGTLAEANTYRFSSKEWNGNAGLYYYGYRFYEPNLQRWLNKDPIGESGGINLLTFTQNTPNNFFDPFGLTTVHELEIDGVSFKIECDGKTLVGVSTLLNGSMEQEKLGDVVIPPRTWVGVNSDSTGGINFGASNRLKLDGPGPFNGSVSKVRFDKDGKYVSSDVEGNFITPDASVRSKLKEQLAKYENMIKKIPEILKKIGDLVGLCP